MVFGRFGIVGPRPLACARPHYETKAYGPDSLFQGTLSDPINQAAALGFRGKTIQTVETGCEGAIDFHFLDANAALFGLNDHVYRIERQKP